MSNTGKHINSSKLTFLLAIVAAVVSFTIQIFYNTFVITLRSLPDEMGAIYLASTLAGNDWTYIMTHPAQYYGSLSAFIMYPFFCFVHDPLVLYQCLLGVGAFLRSIPAIICFYISIKYLHINNLHIVFWLSVSSCFLAPTRATNIDNEPSLILCCWLLVLLIMALSHTSQKKKKICLSTLLSLVLCVSLLAHTRAIIYSLAVVCVILLFHFLTGQSLVNYRSFMGSFGIIYIFSKSIVSHWTRTLYPIEDTTEIANTSESLAMTVSEGLAKLLGKYGLQSFSDLFTSNLLAIFVFSGGIIIFCFWMFIFHLSLCTKNRIVLKRKTEKISLLFPLMFCIIGGGIGLIGVCVTWIDSALNQRIYGSNLTRGYFYLRYYSSFFGPLLMLLIGYWFVPNVENKIRDKRVKQIALLSALTFVTCTFYCWFSFLGTTANIHSHENSDWFYYFAPFSMDFTSWPDSVQSASYYLVAIKFILIFFGILSLFYKYKKRLGMILCTLFFLLYQYSYSVFFWDRPFCYSTNYYQSADAIYELSKMHPTLFSEIDEISYLNPKYGPQYIVQFILTNTRIVLEVSADAENIVILGSSLDYILKQNIDANEYWYLPLDDNEYLFVKGDRYVTLFLSEDLTLIPYY